MDGDESPWNSGEDNDYVCNARVIDSGAD